VLTTAHDFCNKRMTRQETQARRGDLSFTAAPPSGSWTLGVAYAASAATSSGVPVEIAWDVSVLAGGAGPGQAEAEAKAGAGAGPPGSSHAFRPPRRRSAGEPAGRPQIRRMAPERGVDPTRERRPAAGRGPGYDPPRSAYVEMSPLREPCESYWPRWVYTTLPLRLMKIVVGR
jgi:hypothetical protein